MKQIRNIFLAAASIAALFACNKEIEVPEEIKQDVNYVTVSFNAETAPVTKVSLTPNAGDTQFSPAWVENDGMAVEYIYDDGEDIGGGTATATFNGTKFNMDLPDKTGEWEYTAYYPSKTAIPFGAARTQAGDAFNGAYDIMNGSLSVPNGAPGKDGNGQDIVIPMGRFTAIQYFHFTSDIDEPLVSATLTVDDVADPIAAETVAFDGSNLVKTSPSQSITLTFSGETNAKDFKLWFSVLPGGYNSMSLTIETTNYTKTITRSTGDVETFEAGKLYKVSGVKLNNWTTYYNKITSTEGLMNGTYLIVYEGDATHDAVAFDGGLSTLDAASNTINVTIDNNRIKASNITDAASFIISLDNGTVKSASNKYIGVSSNSNGLKQSDVANTYTNSFAIDSEENAVISAVFEGSNMSLRYNYGSNQTRFRYYASSGQQPIALYLKYGTGTAPTIDTRTEVTLSFDPSNPSAITLGDDFTEPNLTIEPNTAQVSYSVETSPANIATIDPASGELTISGAGTIIVTASVSDETTYKPASASYTLTVNAPAGSGSWELVSSISGITAGDLYLLATFNKQAVYNGNISSGHLQTVAVSPANNSIAATDLPASAARIEFVSAGSANTYYLKVGSTYISATAASSGNFKNNGTDPFGWTFSDVSGGLKAVGTTVAAQIRSYDNSSFRSYASTATNGNAFYLYKFVSGGSTPTPTTYSISIDNGITNGTVEASLDSNITEGTEVTLTITPDSNYELATLIVDETDVASQVSNGSYTFEMPGHNVNVNATFSSTNTGGGSTTVSQDSFSTTSGSIDDHISFTSYQGGAGNVPANYNNGIRLYQISGTNDYGGYITISAASGYSITSITIGSTSKYETSIKYQVDNGDLSASETLAKSSTKTVSGISASSVTFYNVGTGSNGRLEIGSISVTYTSTN